MFYDENETFSPSTQNSFSAAHHDAFESRGRWVLSFKLLGLNEAPLSVYPHSFGMFGDTIVVFLILLPRVIVDTTQISHAGVMKTTLVEWVGLAELVTREQWPYVAWKRHWSCIAFNSKNFAEIQQVSCGENVWVPSLPEGELVLNRLVVDQHPRMSSSFIHSSINPAHLIHISGTCSLKGLGVRPLIGETISFVFACSKRPGINGSSEKK